MKGIVYQIYIDSHPDIHYVGSTTNTLHLRWRQHKKAFKLFLTNEKKTVSIYPYFQSYGIDNFKIRMIQEYEVVDNKHLLAYEQLWINKLKPININKILYKNRDIIRAIDRLDYQKNKVKHLERCKIYYEQKREEILERNNIYREKNKEAIKKTRKKLYVCPCSPTKEQLIDHKSRHERTIKHQKYLQTLEETKE